MTAVDPDIHTRAIHHTAAHLLDLADRYQALVAKELAAHRAGNTPSAYVLAGRVADAERLLLVTHQRADAAHGATAIRRALTVERRLRARKAP